MFSQHSGNYPASHLFESEIDFRLKKVQWRLFLLQTVQSLWLLGSVNLSSRSSSHVGACLIWGERPNEYFFPTSWIEASIDRLEVWITNLTILKITATCSTVMLAAELCEFLVAGNLLIDFAASYLVLNKRPSKSRYNYFRIGYRWCLTRHLYLNRPMLGFY